MNYVYDPQHAAKIESYVNYICPVTGAQDAMRQMGTDLGDADLAALAEDPLIFPTEADLAETHIFRALPPDERSSWRDVLGDDQRDHGAEHKARRVTGRPLRSS
jgi:spermidine/putrescine transport system substrate-binding protein